LWKPAHDVFSTSRQDKTPEDEDYISSVSKSLMKLKIAHSSFHNYSFDEKGPWKLLS
jgi:hypothetical protein